MAGIVFGGDLYNDDRMFVLHLCRCTSARASDGSVSTTILHDGGDPDSEWCLVTYRNTSRYPAVRVDRFKSQADAQFYLEEVEPTVPLISLGGQSPRQPLPYQEYVAWKKRQGWEEYDYTRMYPPGGDHPREVLIEPGR
jgi:hypothetical protein